jgi:hypothetical protein
LIAEEYRERLRPAEAEFIAPMLATLTTSYFSDTGWLFERKLDGVRTLAVRGGHGTRLYSRNHKPMNAPYPEIAEALDAQAPGGMVADGEIVAFDGEQTSFSKLQARIGLSDPNRARATGVPVILYLFDLLVLDGYDLTELPLRERKRLLSEAVEFEDPIRFSEHRDTDGQAYLKQACASGWEGLIAKRAEATYHPGASAACATGTGGLGGAIATSRMPWTTDLACSPSPAGSCSLLSTPPRRASSSGPGCGPGSRTTTRFCRVTGRRGSRTLMLLGLPVRECRARSARPTPSASPRAPADGYRPCPEGPPPR